jgi:hypothetical protein
MRALIEYYFPKTAINFCFESLNDAEFGIFDPLNSKCIIQKFGNKRHFTVKNPTQKTILFLAIDKCLLHDGEEKGFERCDFAIFDDKVFCFVEIKEPSFGQKAENLKKARSQLLSTIKYFKEKIPFESIRIEAYASVGSHSPSRPATLASDLNIEFEFRKLRAKLYQDGNEKVFQ